MRSRPVLVGMVLALAVVTSAAGGLSPQQVSFVPWKVLDPGAAPADAPLVLYWIPSSPDELKRSELVVSERLTAYAGRCVAMHVIRAEDGAAVSRVSAGHKLPVVVLMDGDAALARVDNDGGLLRVGDVEAAVRSAVEGRQAAVDAALSDAKKRLAAGDIEEAASIYRSVAAQRCMFPREAKAAARALRKLGLE